LDVAVKLSRLSGYQLIGLAQALLQQAIDIAAENPGATLDPEFERLQQAKALLDGESVPELLQ
jgi:ABC-type phosphate/phosphonate transport system ATPase subunit